MTRTASAELKAHLASPVTTVCTLWTITRRDGQVFRFTDHEQPITYESNLYEVGLTYSASDIQTESSMAVPNLDVMGLIDNTRLTERDIKAGLWDYAEILIELINYADLTQGSIILRSGTLGEIRTGRNKFNVELRGLAQEYQQTIVQLYSPLCRAKFGDSRCGVPINYLWTSGTIDEVTSRKRFRLSISYNVYDYGIIEFTSGENNGLAMEVKTAEMIALETWITTQLPMPYDVEVGDTFRIRTGCNKTVIACQAYDNIVNFRGEPYVPFADKIMKGSAK